MFRKIDAERPTLLLDEVDALFGSRTEGTEPIRAILNAGNRPGAAVARMAGEGANMIPVDFSVYCPKVLAGINTSRWPDTLVDRAIVMRLQRKKPGEEVQRFRHRKLQAETEQLRAQLARWAYEHTKALRDAEPEFPAGLDDRAAEAWEPLIAIAELAEREGAHGVTDRARSAALELAREGVENDDAHGVLALAAIRSLFGDRDLLFTEAMVKSLNSDDQLPFGDYRNGAGLSDRGLAKLLRPFAIRSQNVRIGEQQAKGYRRSQFTDAWERYCPTKGPTPTATPTGDPFGASDPSQRPIPITTRYLGTSTIRPRMPLGRMRIPPKTPMNTGIGTLGRIRTRAANHSARTQDTAARIGRRPVPRLGPAASVIRQYTPTASSIASVQTARTPTRPYCSPLSRDTSPSIQARAPKMCVATSLRCLAIRTRHYGA